MTGQEIYTYHLSTTWDDQDMGTLRKTWLVDDGLYEVSFKFLNKGCSTRNTVCVSEAVSEAVFGYHIAQISPTQRSSSKANTNSLIVD